MRCLAFLVLLLTLPARAAEIRVFAAASLTDALEEIAHNYERGNGDHVVFNFEGSSILARQILAGAPADLFLSADEEKMNLLAARGLVRERANVLSNTLVVVGNVNVTRPADLAGKTVAIAEAHVPAGIYARRWLQSAGVWERVAPRVVPTSNVRGALAALVAGNVDAAIVYATDVRAARGVRVAYSVPRQATPPITYPFAVLKDAEEPAAARRFFVYLRSPAAMAVFAKHGFLMR